MRVYISGPITNCKDYKENFARAEKVLRARGFEVVNPAYFEEFLPQLTYEEYMTHDLCLLDLCNAVYMLTNWQQSLGANREYGYALGKGLIIWEEPIGRNDEIKADKKPRIFT